MRQKTRGQEIRVGLVTLGAIAALVGGIIWGKGFGFSVTNRPLRFHFPNAAGIDVGSPVTLNGVRQGSVTRVETQSEGVIIDALVETQVPIRSDASARIEMAELTGGKRIALTPGASTRPLADDAIIEGRVAGDPAALLSDIGEITASARKLVIRLDTAIAAVNGILADGTVKLRVDNILTNVDEASGDARALVRDNRREIARTIEEVNRLVRSMDAMLKEAAPKVDRTLTSAELAAGDAQRAIATAEVMMTKASDLVDRLDRLTATMLEGDGAVSMMLRDSAFANDLRQTIAVTRAFIEQTKKHGVNINISLGRKP